MENQIPSQDITPWHQTRWARILAVLVAVGMIVGIWSLSGPSLPDQQEAEQEVASGVGQAEKTKVTANCTVPDDTGYTCRLRNVAGSYGYSITTFHDGPGTTSRRITSKHGLTHWDFPLDADGTGTKTLDAAPPGDLSLAISAVLMMISGSIGDTYAFSLSGAIKCGDRVTGDVTTCTVRAPVLSATLRALGDHKYQLTYRVALPRS